MLELSLAIGMITAPRPVPTVHASLASLRAAGFESPVHVFDDASDVHIDDPAAIVYRRSQRLHDLPNWYSALRTLADTDTELCLVLEDDTTWLPAAHDALALWLRTARAVMRESFGALSLHCMRHNSVPIEWAHGVGAGELSPGMYRSLSAEVWGSQALIFPRRSAHALLASPLLMQASIERGRIDRSVGYALRELGLNLFFLLPCLVRHDLGIRNSSLYGSKGAVIDAPGRECLY